MEWLQQGCFFRIKQNAGQAARLIYPRRFAPWLNPESRRAGGLAVTGRPMVRQDASGAEAG
jgi:hypothetical protein